MSGEWVALSPGQVQQVAHYLTERLALSHNYFHQTGRSSDELVLFALTGDGPWRDCFPLDRADWRRCLLAYARAPEFLRERMRPVMREYRSNLRTRDLRIGSCHYPHPVEMPIQSAAGWALVKGSQ